MGERGDGADRRHAADRRQTADRPRAADSRRTEDGRRAAENRRADDGRQADEGPTQTDLLQGTLDVMVLKVLAYETTHGWGVSQRLREWSDGVFEVQQGSVYPALQRLKRRGWVKSAWRRTENNRRARYYELTAEGRRQLEREVAQWERTSAAVDRVLRYAWRAG